MSQPYAQPSPPAMQQPAARRRKWPWILGGVLTVMLIGCGGLFALVGFGAKSAADGLDELDDNQKGANAVAAALGKPGVDGDLQFTVTKVKCGVAEVGADPFGQRAQGQYCLVDVRVKNVGKQAQTFSDSEQKAYDAKDTELSVDSGAAVYANGENQVLFTEINPGNTMQGKLVFDVPEGTELTSVVLHESMFSAGVKVDLP